MNFANHSRRAARWFGLLIIAGLLPALFPIPVRAAVPEWIWGEKPRDDETRYFRKTFKAGNVREAVLYAAIDDSGTIFLNGREVASISSWQNPVRIDVTGEINPTGENVFAVRCHNARGPAGFVARLELTIPTGGELLKDPNLRRITHVVTDSSWLTASEAAEGWKEPGFKPSGWARATGHGALGAQPWGNILASSEATPAGEIEAPPGFKVELVRSAQIGEGSWVCMTLDARDRIIVSPQAMSSSAQGGLLRLTPPQKGRPVQVEPIRLPVGAAQGLLHAFDSLYVNGRGPEGQGLYRLRDTTGDDQFDSWQLLKQFEGPGEHGPHAVVLGPDNMIYIMNGNHVKPPEGLSPHSPFKNHAEDLLLPRMWDAGGHAVGVLAPGGYVVRTDRDGKQWELLLAGFRNAYDLAFNKDGEMFTYDSDMEWDIGAPWYRPVRINHCVSGGEYGWRSGTGKWPEYYPDSLPGNLDMGLGSPTGLIFGTRSHFPPKYQKALFACDWAYGIIYAVHLEPEGATYSGTFEKFIVGKPLNVTDLEFTSDGSMYFITGGRGTQSGLYRVSYSGSWIRTPRGPGQWRRDREAAKARTLRRQLESYHGHRDPRAITVVWPHLDSEDRWIRYAARVAIEHQDVDWWRDRALRETRVNAGLSGLLALARNDGPESQKDLLKALAKFPLESLTEARKLEKLRVIQLSFIRQGRPQPEMRELAIEKLDRQYPAATEPLNRELSQLLVYLQSPAVIEKTLALLDAAATQEEELHYALVLRNVTGGWTLEQRERYFNWFHKAREYTGGNSFARFLANIKTEAIATLSPGEKLALATVLDDTPVALPQPQPREFVKQWTAGELIPHLEKVSRGRSFEQGRRAFIDTQCMACHRFGTQGGAVGPDLTAASSRFNRRDLLEKIIDPSRSVSDQYQNLIVIKHDDSDVIGRLVHEDNDKIVLITEPLENTRVEILKSDIRQRMVSPLSPMPEGLIDVLSQEEILDLLAYIESGGRTRAENFAK